MNFKLKKTSRKIGKSLGFAVMFLIFSSVLYLVLSLSNKLPDNWNYLSALLAAAVIVLIGFLIRMLIR